VVVELKWPAASAKRAGTKRVPKRGYHRLWNGKTPCHEEGGEGHRSSRRKPGGGGERGKSFHREGKNLQAETYSKWVGGGTVQSWDQGRKRENPIYGGGKTRMVVPGTSMSGRGGHYNILKWAEWKGGEDGGEILLVEEQRALSHGGTITTSAAGKRDLAERGGDRKSWK